MSSDKKVKANPKTKSKKQKKELTPEEKKDMIRELADEIKIAMSDAENLRSELEKIRNLPVPTIIELVEDEIVEIQMSIVEDEATMKALGEGL